MEMSVGIFFSGKRDVGIQNYAENTMHESYEQRESFKGNGKKNEALWSWKRLVKFLGKLMWKEEFENSALIEKRYRRKYKL